MRFIKMTQIDENINSRRQEVNANLQCNRKGSPRVRRKRSRSLDERIALTQITKESVERAKREGKMKMIGKRKMYYDPAE
ncbi:hypothetical protein [Virgibacillus ainsalahensis]